MSPESLFLISGVAFGVSFISLLAGIGLWFLAGIPEAFYELKETAAVNHKKIKPAKVKLIEDIVITHCVSTLAD